MMTRVEGAKPRRTVSLKSGSRPPLRCIIDSPVSLAMVNTTPRNKLSPRRIRVGHSHVAGYVIQLRVGEPVPVV